MSTPVDGIALRLFQALDIRPHPPVDEKLLADRMGVTSIENATMVEDGRLETSNGSARILVRRGLSAERRRFTILHELGHLLLMDGGVDVVARRALPVSTEEERFCDRLAASLLLPRGWVRARFEETPRTLATVRRLSGQAGASLAATVVRLNEVLGWGMMLLRWRRSARGWAFAWGAGVPGRIHGRIRSAPSTGKVLDSIGRRTRADLKTCLPVLVLGTEIEVPAQVSVRDSSALVLVQHPAVEAGVRGVRGMSGRERHPVVQDSSRVASDLPSVPLTSGRPAGRDNAVLPLFGHPE